jgi:hypothetical protein
MRSETIQWFAPDEAMPVAWITVLVRTEGIPDGDPMHKERVRAAYIADIWYDEDEQFQWNIADRDGGRLYETVIEWAHLPKGSR